MRQIGIEFHEVTENVKRYFTIIQELYKLGFVTIAWDPNLTTTSFTKGPFRYFEIVFRRSDVAACKVWQIAANAAMLLWILSCLFLS